MMNIAATEGFEKSSHCDSDASHGGAGQALLQLSGIHCFELFEARDA
ncbi:MAG: hypothetical protein AB9903_26950 [Vulcanimicrobiota bacterium]